MVQSFQVSWPLKADQFGQNITVPNTECINVLSVQLHEPKTLTYLSVDSASHLAKKLSTLELPRDGATGAHRIQSYLFGKALLAEQDMTVPRIITKAGRESKNL